jgi:hypothetical protein
MSVSSRLPRRSCCGSAASNRVSGSQGRRIALAGGKSHAITLPAETLRAWGWAVGTEVHLDIDEVHHTFTVRELPPPGTDSHTNPK